MRVVTFQRDTQSPEPGIVVGESVIGLRTAGFPDLISLLTGGEDAFHRARLASEKTAESVPLANVKLLAPVPRPPKIFCVGLNYRDHAIESNMEIPKVPTVFSKFSTSVIGPGESIVLPKKSEKPDYEAELAVVIGKGGRYIQEADWESHVFGYTCVNDVSARDYQLATSQWLMGKTFDTFAPMGPWIVTKDEVPDPHALDIKMTIGGQVLQNSNTKELIFKIPFLIEFLSSVCTLEPGDVICTGTPAGVGLGHKPPRWLKAGDVCTISIHGIGDLINPVAAEV